MLHSGALGLLIGMALLKLGNPVIFDHKVVPPTTLWEWAIGAWPVVWGYGVLGFVVLAGLPLLRKPSSVPLYAMLLPLGWLAWQALSASRSINPGLSMPVLRHFAACVICFYMGLLCLPRAAVGPPGSTPTTMGSQTRGGKVMELTPNQFSALDLFWLAVLGGWMTVLSWGFDQHLGGLEATRQFVYAQPGWQEKFSSEYLQKLASNRIFSTLFYPNALAGVILLLEPPLLAWLWRFAARYGGSARGLLVLSVGLCGLACLSWSGSKGGWLVALVITATAWIVCLDKKPEVPSTPTLPGSDSSDDPPDNDTPRSHVSGIAPKKPRGWRPASRLSLAVAFGLVLGLGVFCWRFSAYFQKGATSVGARVQCWQVCARVISEFPVFGSGPGTFGTLYRERRLPGSEMAWLAHNDYLQQASDSGLVGALLFLELVPGALMVLWRRLRPLQDPELWGIWLGLIGWALHETIEFGLYLPALAWPAFLLLGWLWSATGSQMLKTVDNPGRRS